MGFHQRMHIDPGLESGGQQVEAAELAMQEDGIGRRAVPEVALHAERQAGVADADGEVGIAEIVRAGMAQRLAGDNENVEDDLALPFPYRPGSLLELVALHGLDRGLR